MKNISANISRLLLGAAVAVVLSACLPEKTAREERPKEVAGQGERVLMDELSLWNNPSNAGISYADFEPLRVRATGAEYLPRTGKFAGAGNRYGEIRLTAENGSLLYLPRLVALDADDELSVLLRTKSEAGKWQISVYPEAGKVARVDAATQGVKTEQRGEWLAVTIPLAALKTETHEIKIANKKSWRDAGRLLSQYNLPKGYLYGIEFSLAGGKAGDVLYIDRLALVKKAHTATDKLEGRLVPALDGAEILLQSDKGEAKAKANPDGTFEVPVPEGAKIVSVVAATSEKVMSPRTGRYLEIGTYLPKLVIPTDDPIVERSLDKGDSNDGLYVYEEKYGPRVEPDQHFLVQVTNDGKLVTASELATNRWGYIDRDRTADNPDDAYRVMILGECHHMGLHIAQSDIWWNEAEAAASIRTSRPVEFVSASFNHASWTSSWPAFRDFGADMKPDIVLLPMIDPGVLNLVVEEYMMDWLGASQGHRPAYQFELDANGKLVHKPNDPDWQLHRTTLPEAEHKRIRDQYVSLPYVPADDAQLPQWVRDSLKLSTKTLKEFGKLAKQRKSRFAVLYISNFGSSKTDLVTENGVTYDPNKFRTLMQKMAKDAGVEFIDISNELHMSMNGQDAKRIFFSNNGHFTPYAHYRYGQVLAEMFSSVAEKK